MTATLFATCVIPACNNPVVDVGRPCERCVGDFTAVGFGPMLARVAAPPMTAEQIAERDQAMAAAQSRRRDPGRKANQLCWICDARRTCIRVMNAGRYEWECDHCREIT